MVVCISMEAMTNSGVKNTVSMIMSLGRLQKTICPTGVMRALFFGKTKRRGTRKIFYTMHRMWFRGQMENIIFFIRSRILQSLLLLSVIRLRENLNTWETFIFRTEGYTVRILRIGSFLTQLCWWTMTAGFTFMLEVDSHPMVILGTRLKDYL